jgi:anaerobic magnesium-protoporphyrin IX monomethyl ester cyclase
LPGTKFYENVKKELTHKQNWSDSNDLAMMFQGTFAPAFYKLLHRYVHSRYSIQRGLLQLKAIFGHTSMKGFSLRHVVSMLYHIPVSFIQAYQLRRIRI